jgi:paraquat-inducible protein B
MTPSPPNVSIRTGLPLVWIVPILALLVGCWMIFREYRDRGPEISIDFGDGSGIKPGATILEYKGVPVGVVRTVELKPELDGVLVRLRLDKSAANLAREGALFWVVQPEIGLTGVRGLDTLFSGVRIKLRPGSGPPATHFQGSERAPPAGTAAEGRVFILHGEQLGSLNPGAPVYFREVKVGAVESSRLANDAASVLVQIRIDTPYVDLVRINSRFWNAGGASFRFSLLGAEMKSTSLQSLFSGGVAFATPDTGRQLANVAPEGHRFTLHSEAEKDWLRWQPRIPITPLEDQPEFVSPSAPPAFQATADN